MIFGFGRLTEPGPMVQQQSLHESGQTWMETATSLVHKGCKAISPVSVAAYKKTAAATGNILIDLSLT